MEKKSVVKALAACLLMAGTPAFAANVVHTIGWTVNNPDSSSSRGASVTATSVEYLPESGVFQSKSGTVGAGEFDVSLNGSPTFEAICTDIFHSLSFGKNYSDWTISTAATLYTDERAKALGKLWTLAHDGAGNDSHQSNAKSAAFNLAVWEIVYESKREGGHLVFNLGNGAFTGSNSATSVAQGWLNAIQVPNTIAVTPLYALHSIGGGTGKGIDGTITQDLLTPVPEPETYAMFLAGLGMMGAVARRRGARKA